MNVDDYRDSSNININHVIGQNYFSIENNSNRSFLVNIFDLQGHEVHYSVADNTYYLNSTGKGIFLIKIQLQNRFLTKKILVR
jgi:hypothetical protein